MKSSRFRYSYRDNASRLHCKIGNVLRSGSIFSKYQIYQEYPVKRINPEYISASHKFDWVVLDLYLVIEAMGEQHSKPCTFGGISYQEAENNYYNQVRRDNQKMDAAVSAGFTYLAIPYLDIEKINENYLWTMYKKEYNSLPLLKTDS